MSLDVGYSGLLRFCHSCVILISPLCVQLFSTLNFMFHGRGQYAALRERPASSAVHVLKKL